MQRALSRRIPLITAAFVLLLAGPAVAQALAPAAVTGGATGVERDVAVLHGSINPRGQSTQYWFEYGRTERLGARTAATDGGNASDSFEVDQQIGSLRGGTTYRYRVVARNATGTTQGAVRTFRTASAPAPKPVATTRPVRDITQTTATLAATVNNRSRDATYRFEWGPTTSYGQSTPATPLPANAQNVDVTAALTGLTANTTYHVRVVLQVANETVRGADRSFRTAKVPNGLLVRASGNPVGYGAGVDVFGVLAGSDNTGTTIRVQADTFPFDGSWSTVASGRTDATGAYRIHVDPLLTSSQLRTVAETSPAVTSQPITVGVRLTTSLRVGDRRVRRGQRVRFTGQITPTQGGSAISIQHRRANRWVTVSHTRAGARSRFSTRVRIKRTGKYRVVARPTDGGHVMGASASRYIRVGR
jgi:hypothetical protein